MAGEEAFICYELVRVKEGVSLACFGGLARNLEELAERARGLGYRELAERISEIHSRLSSLLHVVERALGEVSASIDELASSSLCGLRAEGICTLSELSGLLEREGRRGAIECFKRNIVACRDAASELVDLEPGVTAVEALYYSPSGRLTKAVFLYRPGKEREVAVRTDALAVFEKCLGVRAPY